MPREPLIPIRFDSYKPLRELVFESLRQAIMTGQLRPGERLMEVQLANELGVSRTPVREAIRKLELEGLVVMIPRKGAYVSRMSTRDIQEVFEIRATLEGLAATLAVERATEQELDELQALLGRIAECIARNDVKTMVEVDTEFHRQLFQCAHNSRLVQIMQNLREYVQRFRSTSLAYPGRMKVALDEHRQVVQAIRRRDREQAQALAYWHIVSAEKGLMDAIRQQEAAGQAGRPESLGSAAGLPNSTGPAGIVQEHRQEGESHGEVHSGGVGRGAQ
ncbi:MAG: GntR family transcriptional regulator [Firmicutes bacterium]|nr:GntR family transcriptional regulator [Bacillota bacterium]